MLPPQTFNADELNLMPFSQFDASGFGFSATWFPSTLTSNQQLYQRASTEYQSDAEVSKTSGWISCKVQCSGKQPPAKKNKIKKCQKFNHFVSIKYLVIYMV